MHTPAFGWASSSGGKYIQLKKVELRHRPAPPANYSRFVHNEASAKIVVHTCGKVGANSEKVL
jgi:enamine deaminase RidA (YjgF/YER057c/UK114 family)